MMLKANNALPTTLSLGVVDKVLHSQVDHQGIRRTKCDVGADVWEQDGHHVACSLEPKAVLLVRWVYGHIVQSRLRQI